MISQALNRILCSSGLIAIGSLNVGFYMLMAERADGSLVQILPKYVSPGFQLATLVGGLGLMVVGLFLLLTHKVKSGCGHDHTEDEACLEGHDHSEMNPLIAMMILGLPIVFSVYHTQHKFTEVELNRRSEADINPEMFEGREYQLPVFSLDSLDKYKQKNANGAYLMGVMELFLSGGDPQVSKVLDGVKVQVEGAVRKQPGEADNPAVKRMYRMIMQCCAADMQAIPIKLYLSEELAETYTFPEHEWLKLEATLNYELDKQGNRQAVLKVHQLEKSIPPDSEILLSGANSILQDKL